MPASVATVATSGVAILGTIFGVPEEATQSLSGAIERAAVIIGALVADAIVVCRYIRGRSEVKQAAKPA